MSAMYYKEMDTVTNSSCTTITSDIQTNTPGGNIRKYSFKPFLGIIYMFTSCVFQCLVSVYVKQLTYIDPGELSLIRNLGILVFSLPIAVYFTDDILGKKEDRVMLAFRGFLSTTALYLNLIAYRCLPLAEAAILMSTLPAVVTFFARLYLKEPCGYMQSFALVLTTVGVLISVRITELLSERTTVQFDSTYAIGVACAISSVLTFSFTALTLRKMKDVHFSVIMIYYGFTGIVENATITGLFFSYDIPRCGWNAWQMMLISVFGFIGYMTLVNSFQAENAGIASVAKASFDILLAIVFQILFFGFVPDSHSFIGASLVLISIAIIGVKKVRFS